MKHEDYGGYRHGRGNVSGSDRLQVDTAYATASRTVVESPIFQMQAGLPSKMTAVRPTKISHPHFVVSGEQDLDVGDLPVLDSTLPEGKFILEALTNENEDDFTATEIDLLAAVAIDGLQSDWQALDVWD